VELLWEQWKQTVLWCILWANTPFPKVDFNTFLKQLFETNPTVSFLSQSNHLFPRSIPDFIKTSENPILSHQVTQYHNNSKNSVFTIGFYTIDCISRSIFIYGKRLHPTVSHEQYIQIHFFTFFGNLVKISGTKIGFSDSSSLNEHFYIRWFCWISQSYPETESTPDRNKTTITCKQSEHRKT